MRPSRATASLALVFVAAGLAWSGPLAWGHLAGAPSILDRIEGPLLDLRFLIGGARKAPPGLFVVAIDDRTVEAAGRFPLPRRKLAELIRIIARHRPKVIAIDMLFVDQGPPGDDADLRQALQQGPIIIGAAALFAAGADGARWHADGVPLATSMMDPIEAFRAVAGVGFTNVAPDYAGAPRHVPLLIAAADGMRPSFVLSAAAAAAGSAPKFRTDHVRVGALESDLDLGDHLALRFYGPRGTIPTLSAQDVFTSDSLGALLTDSVVVIGAAATGVGDRFTTPFDPVMPGAEILATGIGHLLSGEALKRTRAVRTVDAAVAMTLPAAMVILMSLRHMAIGLALCGLIFGTWLAAVVIAFVAANVWLSIALPVAAALPIAMLFGAARLLLDHGMRRNAQRAETVLRGFQPPVFADRLRAQPDFLATPVQLDAAVLFVDLNGFTGLAETMSPEETRALLHRFHTIVDAIVTRHGGLVMTFMGDGAMIGFGVPNPGCDDARNAIEAAQEMARSVGAWLASLRALDEAPMGVKLGAHYGSVTVSRLGGDSYQQITLSGDCVNVASRLMAVAAASGACLACSEALLTAANRALDRCGFTSVHSVEIRGRAEPLPVSLWSPVGL